MDPTPSTGPPDTTTEPDTHSLGRWLVRVVAVAVPLLCISCAAGMWVMGTVNFAWSAELCSQPSLGDGLRILSGGATLGVLVAWWHRQAFAIYVRRPHPLVWWLLHVVACIAWVGLYCASSCQPVAALGGLSLLSVVLLFAMIASAFARRPYRGRMLIMWLTALVTLSGVAYVGLELFGS